MFVVKLNDYEVRNILGSDSKRLVVAFKDGWILFYKCTDYDFKKCILVIDIDLAHLSIIVNSSDKKKCGFILTKESGYIEFFI